MYWYSSPWEFFTKQQNYANDFNSGNGYCSNGISSWGFSDVPSLGAHSIANLMLLSIGKAMKRWPQQERMRDMRGNVQANDTFQWCWLLRSYWAIEFYVDK